MQRSNENLPRISYAANSRRRAPIFFLASADQPAMHHSGMEVSPGEIVVYSSAAAHHHWSHAPVHWGGMSLTPDDLSAVGRALTGRDVSVPSVTHLVRPSLPLMSRLMDLHETAGQLAKTMPDILAHAEVARALEHALLHAMIACLTESPPIQMTAGGRHHLAIVGRLEELLTANPDRPLYLAEICAAVGASERTLRASCQEHLGMGPVRCLWLRRMHLARRALLRATPETGSVTEIALNHGFWELGRFSVAYRGLFGESPRRHCAGRQSICGQPMTAPSPCQIPNLHSASRSSPGIAVCSKDRRAPLELLTLGPAHPARLRLMPRSGTSPFSDPDEYLANFRGAGIDLVFTGPGTFKARLTWVELPQLHLLRAEENLPRIACVSSSSTRVTISFRGFNKPTHNFVTA
jgi:AraC-like DNA-binding protein